MSNPNLDRWQLSVNEIYPRQALYGFQLSPDGKLISFVLQNDRRTVEITDIEGRKLKEIRISDICFLSNHGGYPRPLGNVSEYSSPAVWSPDGNWLAFEKGARLYVMPSGGGEAIKIYEGKLYHPPLNFGDAHVGYPRWSPDSRDILFTTREENRTVIKTTSVDGRTLRSIFVSEDFVIGCDWSPDSSKIAFVTRSLDGWVGDIRVTDMDSGETTILTSEQNFEYQKPIAIWLPNGRGIILRSNRSGWSKLWISEVDGKRTRQLTDGTWDDYSFRVSPDGNEVVYASRDTQTGTGDDLWIIEISNGRKKRLTNHLGVNVPLAWSRDNRIYYWHSSPTEPGDLWVVAPRGNEPEQLTLSAPVDLQRKLSEPKEVMIPVGDGAQVAGLVYFPSYYKQGEKYPPIVWVRGGPTSISRLDFQPFYNWLANQGYVVITLNYRGSIGYGIAHMEAVACDGLGKNDLDDVLAAGRFARTLQCVELGRGVGIGGHSWGGYLTLMALTQAPCDFSCGVAGAAIADWQVQQSETEVRYYDRWLLGGWAYEDPARVAERSPMSFAERIKAPLFVYHGEEDHDVPFPQIGPFVEKARSAGANVVFVTYPSEGHSIKKVENQADRLDRIRKFYRKYLQPWNMDDNPCGNQVQT